MKCMCPSASYDFVKEGDSSDDLTCSARVLLDLDLHLLQTADESMRLDRRSGRTVVVS